MTSVMPARPIRRRTSELLGGGVLSECAERAPHTSASNVVSNGTDSNAQVAHPLGQPVCATAGLGALHVDLAGCRPCRQPHRVAGQQPCGINSARCRRPAAGRLSTSARVGQPPTYGSMSRRPGERSHRVARRRCRGRKASASLRIRLWWQCHRRTFGLVREPGGTPVLGLFRGASASNLASGMALATMSGTGTR